MRREGGVAEVSADLHDLGIDGFRDRERAVVLADSRNDTDATGPVSSDPFELVRLLAGVFGDVGALRAEDSTLMRGGPNPSTLRRPI